MIEGYYVENIYDNMEAVLAERQERRASEQQNKQQASQASATISKA
jgi:hypothetical protein